MKKFRRKVLDMLMSNNSGSSLRQQLLDGAPFCSELLYTAIPQRAASGTTGTFTRATTSTWPNNDGYMVTGVAGEIGFVGARRVRNLVLSSEDLTSGWTPNGAGSVTADTITFTAAGGDGWNITGFTGTVGRVYRWSALLSSTAGTHNIRFRVSGAITGNTQITTTPTRITALLTSTTATAVFGIYNGTDAVAGTINCTQMQLEDVTAQTTQTAGEYVSVGVESAPYYHGSMVDGVKCFATDINGAAIPSTTLLGYLAEGARTNLCLQSNAFTTTWTLDGLTPVQDAIGPDGATSAWTFTDNSAVAGERIYQSAPLLTAAAYTLSVFIKKTTGAQTGYPVIDFYPTAGTANFAGMTVDTTNGIATAWTARTGFTMASGISANCVSYNDSFWRVSLTVTGTASNYYVVLYPAGTTNPTQSTGALDATAQGSAVFYGAQLELGSFASPYIATPTIAVARDADVLTYSSAGNILGTVGWAYAEITLNGVTNVADQSIVGTDISGRILEYDGTTSTRPRMYDGTNVTQAAAGTSAINRLTNVASTWGGTTARIVTDTTAVVNGTFDGTMSTATAIGVGCFAAGGNQLDGTIRNVRIGQRQLSASELGAITS